MVRLKTAALRGALLGMGLWAVGAGALHGQSARALVQEGNRLYADGRFAEAHERYMRAMSEDPEAPVIPFNAGNALYQDTDYQRAMEAYQQAIASGDPSLASDAWYNLGNALYRQQQLQPSLEAYKQALRLDPGDADAKHNLERVLQQLQQQQQPQDQPQDEEPDDQQDQQEDQQQGQPQQNPSGGSPEQDPQQGEQPPESRQEPDPSEGEQPRPPENQESSQGQAGDGEPRPDQMTEEEARRLLDAIDENPDEVNRRPASARGRRPTKPW